MHYFVTLNESLDVSKSDLEAMTYGLCYMYSNWAGSIKVPVPCQLAHKIADYHHGFDVHGSIKKSAHIDKNALGVQARFNNTLHYL